LAEQRVFAAAFFAHAVTPTFGDTLIGIAAYCNSDFETALKVY